MKNFLIWLFKDFAYHLYDLAEQKFTKHVCFPPTFNPPVVYTGGTPPFPLPPATQGVAYNQSVIITSASPPPFQVQVADAVISYAGGSFFQGQVITNGMGASATVLFSTPTNLYVSNLVGIFSPGDLINGGPAVVTPPGTTISSLPSGLTVTNPSGGTTIIISGIPTTSGNFFFVIVANSTVPGQDCIGVQEYTIEVAPAIPTRRRRKRANGVLPIICVRPDSDGEFRPTIQVGRLVYQRIDNSNCYKLIRK